MTKTPKSKAPSRVRYEQGHPTVSCRLPRDVYDELRSVIDAEGKSFAGVLKIGLGILEVRVKDEEEIRKRGYAEGYTKGYAEAEYLYKVTYPCNVCGKTITVTSGSAKEAINKYMQEHGWGHNSCHERKQ
jgi:hypothetical protein